MSEIHTGEKAPTSGVYAYVRHLNTGSRCQPTPAEMEIPLSRGETAPPHRSCWLGVLWRLVRSA